MKILLCAVTVLSVSAAQAGPGVCGDPDAGDCCAANGTSGCNDADCCQAVCAIDPFCCVTPWDQLCVDLADSICDVCQQPGACCFADGTCLDVAGLIECTALAGDYQGPGTSCDTVTCVGACCFSDGSCLEVGPSVCDDLGGAFHGIGTRCESVYCVSCTGLIAVPDDFGTIQEAIDFACLGSEIVVAPGIYAETIDFLGKAITVRSSGGRAVTMIDGQEDGSVVTCANGEGPDTVLSGLTITGGDASGGGGLRCENSSPTVTDCSFVENFAGTGGGIHVTNGSPSVSDCVFEGNAAFEGGAMYNVASSLTIVGCVFNGNTAHDRGGAVANIESTTAFEDCTFTANSLDVGFAGFGGAIFNNQGVNTVTRCTFVGNLANGTWNMGGGAIMSIDTTETLTDCHFEGNDGWLGGALSHPDFTPPAEPLLVVNCTFLNNTAMVGGAMHLQDTVATIRNCDIVGNEAALIGGGVFVIEGDDGGAEVTLINTRITGNFAQGQGGGIRSNGANSVSLVNCTVSANVSADLGGGVSNEEADGIVSIVNSVLWANADSRGDGESAQIDVNGGLVDVNYSCIGGLTGKLGGTGNIGDDPLLVDPDNDDFRLSPGSPGIDAGNSTAVPTGVFRDLDGNPRFVADACAGADGPAVDMGAYEFQGTSCDLGRGVAHGTRARSRHDAQKQRWGIPRTENDLDRPTCALNDQRVR